VSHELSVRVAAAQAVLDAWRGTRFAWGRRDCVRLGAAMLRALGRRPALARGGAYRSERGAIAALKRAGFADVEAAVESVLGEASRIAPAAALPGDILGFAVPGVALTALGVAIGGGRILAFLEDGVCHVAPPRLDVAGVGYLAWRCAPKGR